MTETVPQAVADSAQKAAPVAVEIQVGGQLENARKALQITVAEVAQRLRLSEKQVLALETGDLAALPGKTFVRGFVRNYARAVQIDPEPLLKLLDNVDKLAAPKLELPESTHVAMPDQERGINRDLLTIAAGLALVVIAGALYFFLPEQLIESRGEQNSGSEQNMPFEPPQSFLENAQPLPDGGNEPLPPAQTSVPPTPTNLPPVPANATPPAPRQPPAIPRPAASATPASVAPPAAPTTGSARVHLNFSNASWVEVRDRNGHVLSSGQHPAGAQHEVSGTPPLTVIVGRASGVELRYQGQPVTLRPNADSDIARVVLP
ncbi:MAG: DUF4115 domain-containing protein [Zoogloeaceae bacterium]|jgi:cytoskeleton protein RodZ|nr:DUF4115 domain-containing protein [Zoogloeaceae bacterium]